ncbi:hypothetical protein [Streptomyces specialis]|uniref:hypothetical protein n=1 Tax=Streptomyces specialis TaxID=498367 RepID=UPI00073E54EA|nr:hypothetical protein [Streptomyces specialis]
MPRGRYSLHDPHDGTPLGDERFQCAPGPSGWRYVSRTTTPGGAPAGSLDLTLDRLGRPIRLELRAGGWRVRGAALDGVTWVRMAEDTGEQAQEGNAPARAFTGSSPAFLVATARLLRLTGTPGRSTRVRLLGFAPHTLAARARDETWTLTGTEAHRPADGDGTLTVEAYRVDDMETGERHAVHLAGDVVLAAPGVELEELDTPPTDFRTAE